MCRPADTLQSGESDEAESAPSPVQETETPKVRGTPRHTFQSKMVQFWRCLGADGLLGSLRFTTPLSNPDYLCRRMLRSSWRVQLCLHPQR